MEFIIFVGVICLLFWVASVNNRVHALERKLKGQQLAPSAGSRPQAFGASQPMEIPKPVMASASVPVQSAPQSSADETESAAGWLTKIGVLAVIFGIGFFIKYAIDMGWISEWTRVIIGLGAGVLLCVLGHLWKDKFVQYAAALTGGGIALMYFSLFASYQFYHLVPQAVALVGMVIVSAFGVYVAYERKSVALGALAIFGAYLAPIFLASGNDQQIALYAYIGLLTLVAVIISFAYYSSELLFLSFLCSVIDYSLWAAKFLNTGNTWPAAIFAAFLFLLLMIGGAAAFHKHHQAKTLPQDAEKYLTLLAVCLGIFYSLALPILLYTHFHEYLAIMALLGSVGAFIAYALVDRLEIKSLNYSLAFVGTGLLALACIWQFEGKLTDFILIALGLALVAAGAFLKRAELRVWGLLTLVACVFAVLFTPYEVKEYVFILNSKFGLVLAETAALWMAGWIYGQIEATSAEAQAKEAAFAIGSLLLWFGFSWELVQYYQDPASMNTLNLILSLWWIAYGTALIIFGAVAKSAVFKKIAIAIYALAIMKVFLYDVTRLETGYRIVSFVVLGVILLSVSYFYQHNKAKIVSFLEGDDQNKIIS